MLQVHDIRETRVYQEAREKSIKQGFAIVVAKMSARNKSAEEILELDLTVVHAALAQQDKVLAAVTSKSRAGATTSP